MSVTDGMLTIEVPKAALAVFTMIAVVGVLMILPRCVSLFQTLNAGLVRTAEKAGFRIDPVLTGLAGLTWFVVFATLLIGLFTAIVLLIFQPAPTPDTVWSWRFSLAQIAGLTAVLGAIIALPFTIMRLLLNRKQTETAEQGMITDRINKAVEGLGAEKTVTFQRRDAEGNLTYEKHEDGEPNYAKPVIVTETRPNLEVRIGAIYALERIAQDSDRDHVRIMEILCAYIRENAPAKDADAWPELEMDDSEDDGPLKQDWEERLVAFKEEQRKKIAGLTCRTDIQAAITVIGRRSDKQRQLEAREHRDDETAVFVFDLPCPHPADFILDNDYDADQLEAYESALFDWKAQFTFYRTYRLDLRNTNLRGADLSDMNLNGAQFNGSELQGTNFGAAQLQGANLSDARMQGAYLGAACMQGAYLSEARIQGANLEAALAQGANFDETRMQGTDLRVAGIEVAYLGEAQMHGANLGTAHMQGAHLKAARMQGVELREAKMQGADLGEAKMQGANLWNARMQGANLRAAQMQDTILWVTHMQGASLWDAQLQGSYLWATRFDGDEPLSAAFLRGAAMREVDCRSLPLSLEDLEYMFGDGSVQMPRSLEQLSRPSKWPDFILKDDIEVDERQVDRFEHEWRKWQKDPDYTPPTEK